MRVRRDSPSIDKSAASGPLKTPSKVAALKQCLEFIMEAKGKVSPPAMPNWLVEETAHCVTLASSSASPLLAGSLSGTSAERDQKCYAGSRDPGIRAVQPTRTEF
ncbi:unnamed protein product, partial [Iphiclides podalirius]